jgi:hypothetical protein
LVAGILSVGVKRPAREADHLPPSSAEVNTWSYTSPPQYASMVWCSVKKKHRYNFTFTFRDRWRALVNTVMNHRVP